MTPGGQRPPGVSSCPANRAARTLEASNEVQASLSPPPNEAISAVASRSASAFALHGVDSVVRLHERVMGRLVRFVCDFTPVDYGAYTDEYEAVTRAGDVAGEVHRRFMQAFSTQPAVR